MTSDRVWLSMADTPQEGLKQGRRDYFDPTNPNLARVQNSASTTSSGMSTPQEAGTIGMSTPELSDGEQTVATSTVTTTITRAGKEIRTLPALSATHVGSKGLSHRIDKDGAIHLKPVAASSKRKKMRAIVSFRPRQSHFDRFNANSSADQFRGFYTLFWICITLFVLNTFYTSFSDTGQVISLTFATLFSKDAGMLALSDGILISSLFLCVPFVKICQRGWVRYWPTAVWFQHLWQAALLGAVIKWARYREWPWVQSGFFVLHTLCMMMKIHSYMAVNGNMADTYHRMRRIESMLEERVAEVEGAAAGAGKEQLAAAWVKAVSQARKAEEKDDAVSAKMEEWVNLDMQRGSSVARLRKRQAATQTEEVEEEKPKTLVRSASDAKKDGTTVIRDPHPLATHPDSVISDLAHEIELAREDLLSTKSSHHTEPGIIKEETVMWPQNVTYYNFWDYLLVPTLVYELSYPRTTK